jgi:hypothetical protein
MSGIFIGSFVAFGLINVMNPTLAQADEIRLGASPSFFSNVQIAPGESKTITLEVVNNSVFPLATKSTSIPKCTFNIHLQTENKLDNEIYDNFTPEERKSFIPSEWVSFEQNDIKLAPGETKKVNVKISVPSNVDKIEYPLAIDVLQQGGVDPKTGQATTSFNSSIQVPIFVVAGKDELKAGYNINSFDLTDKTAETSIFSLIKGLITFDKATWNKLLYQPLKLSSNPENISYDLPQNTKKTLRELYVTSEKDKTNDKYVVIDDGLKDSDKLDKIEFKDNKVLLHANSKVYTVTFPDKDVLANVKEQLVSLTQLQQQAPNFAWFIDNVKLPKNLDISITKLFATYDIQNTGTKTIVPIGKIDVYNENNKLIDSTVYGSSIIAPGKDNKLIATLAYNQEVYKPGTYTLKSTITPYDGADPEVKIIKITIKNSRTLIIGGVICSIVIVLTGLIILAVKLVKRRKRSKNNKVN